jgi:hypothetical protein
MTFIRHTAARPLCDPRTAGSGPRAARLPASPPADFAGAGGANGGWLGVIGHIQALPSERKRGSQLAAEGRPERFLKG